MTSATSLREQNTNSQKSCSKTLRTCNNSSWFLTPSLSTSFPLSDRKLRGHEGAEPERQRPGAALAQNAPSSCLHSSSLFSLQHLLLQPHYSMLPASPIFTTSALLFLWTVPFVSQNSPLISNSLGCFPSGESKTHSNCTTTLFKLLWPPRNMDHNRLALQLACWLQKRPNGWGLERKLVPMALKTEWLAGKSLDEPKPTNAG